MVWIFFQVLAKWWRNIKGQKITIKLMPTMSKCKLLTTAVKLVSRFIIIGGTEQHKLIFKIISNYKHAGHTDVVGSC